MCLDLCAEPVYQTGVSGDSIGPSGHETEEARASRGSLLCDEETALAGLSASLSGGQPVKTELQVPACVIQDVSTSAGEYGGDCSHTQLLYRDLPQLCCGRITARSQYCNMNQGGITPTVDCAAEQKNTTL